MMKTPEQLKAAIRNIAKKQNLRAQEVLQMYLFERFLERLAASRFKENFILKGGLLISSIIGIAERTTMDMDTTVCGIRMEEDEIVGVIKEIIAIDVADGILFEYISIEPIRDDDAYNNFRVHLQAKYGKINSAMKIDITTGDSITPGAVKYSFPMIFEEKSISIMAYTLETVLAEKYETIIRRNIATTRIRDYYDLYTLYRSRKDEVRPEIFKAAVLNTSTKRDSIQDMQDYVEILKDIRKEPALSLLWDNYVATNKYIGKLGFNEVLDIVDEIAKLLNE